MIECSSSSLNSIWRSGIFFSKASFDLDKAETSIKASLSFVVSAFFFILSNLFSIISKSANINSTLMISISLIGSVLP